MFMHFLWLLWRHWDTLWQQQQQQQQRQWRWRWRWNVAPLNCEPNTRFAFVVVATVVGVIATVVAVAVLFVVEAH